LSGEFPRPLERAEPNRRKTVRVWRYLSTVFQADFRGACLLIGQGRSLLKSWAVLTVFSSLCSGFF
jgi:hypothetical protein